MQDKVRQRGENTLATAFLFLITLAVFSRVTAHYFVTFDDGSHVYNNPYFQPVTLKNLLFFWTGPFHGLFVPVTYTFWGIEAYLSKLIYGAQWAENPFVFHLGNLLLHALCGSLVFLILKRMQFKAMLSFLGASLFLLHPLQVEAVSWVSASKDLLAGVFSLSAIYCWIGSKQLRATLFFILALLSKPVAVVLPLLILILDLGYYRKNLSEEKMLLVWGVLAVPFMWLTKRVQPDFALEYVTPLQWRPAVALDAVLFYFNKLILPFRLSSNYGRTPQTVMALKTLWLEWALVVAGVVFIALRKNARVYFVALGFFVAGLLPTLGFVPFYFQKYSTASDRFAYLSLFGITLLFAWLLSDAVKKPRLVIGLGLLCLGVISYKQTAYWKNDLALISRVAEVSPNSDNHFNFATVLTAEIAGRNPIPGTPRRNYLVPVNAEQKKIFDAQIEYHFREAIRKDPSNARAYNNLGLHLMEQGRTIEAEELYREAVQRDPKLAEAYNNLGVILGKKDRYHEAKEVFEKALQLIPEFASAHLNLGIAYENLQEKNRAREEYQKVVELEPENRVAREKLRAVQ